MDQVHWTDFEEPSEGAEQDGWLLRTCGWLMIVLAAVPSILIGDSHRDGTNFWFWFDVILGGLGLISIGVGTYLRYRGTEPMKRLERVILSDETTP